jgi:hypothetical protein
MALYKALGVLGLKSYHMNEVFMNGEKDMNLLADALDASLLGRGKPYGRAEFDKWFCGYDVCGTYTA